MWRAARASLLSVSVMAGVGSWSGCIDWLEVGDGEDEVVLDLPVGRPMVLPSAPAEAGGRGPIVPATPGLRVPLAGYWTRVRLDVADLLLPYSWIALHAVSGEVVIRLEATSPGTDAPAGTPAPAAATAQSLRAVIPITLPPGTDIGALAGLTLGRSNLARAALALRTSTTDSWQVELERLTFETVSAETVVGSFEGVARRGAKGTRERRCEGGFIALRAPSPVTIVDPAIPDPAVPEPGAR